MMFKLGVLLTICLLLFPLTALQLDWDQPGDHMLDISSEIDDRWFDPVRKCCMRPICMCPCCIGP
uniref:Conotoxin reg3k n=2 Tax=Conus regius TaxID=101314 RepID=CM3K_CONRE